MKAKRTRNSGKWSAARFRSFVVSALRAASRRWPPRAEALKNARRGTMRSKKVNREVYAYLCAACGGLFTHSSIRVDHVCPVVDPKKGFQTFDKFINNLFCEKQGLQVLCIPCHASKTKEERKTRNAFRKKTRLD